MFFWEICRLVGRMVSMSQFSLSKQTSKALILTLRSQAMLIGELLNEDYDYVLTRRLHSRFSKYRSMSWGRFLVSLREVKSSEKILIRRSLLKSGIDFWKCDLGKADEDEKRKFEEFISELVSKEIKIMECSLWRFYRGLSLHRRVRCKKKFWSDQNVKTVLRWWWTTQTQILMTI